MYFQQAKWWNVKTKRGRMTALRMCVWTGFMGIASLIGLDASGPASPSREIRVPLAIKDNLQSSGNDKPVAAVQDTVESRAPVAAKDDLQSSGDDDKPPAVAQDTAESRAPVALKDDLQSSGNGDKPPAAAQDTVESRVPVAAKDDLQSSGDGDKAPATAQDTAESRAPDAAKDDLQSNGNGDEVPATAQNTAETRVPVAVKDDLQSSGKSDEPLAAAQANVASQPMNSAKSIGSREAACCFRTPSARTAKAKPSHITRSAICPADCEAKPPFIVRSSERMPSAPDRTLLASEPKGTSLGLSAFRGGRAILGQAVDASGAVLMGGKQVLGSVISAVW